MQKWAKIDEIIKLLKEHSMEEKANSKKIKTPIAIMINGKWGTGKSHMYREYLAPEITNQLSKSPIYTSVFGKKDENEIIQDLVAQFLRKENKLLDKCKVLFNTILHLLKLKGISINADVSFIFKALEKEDLKDSIVCIDDFERLSEKIPIEDVLGLISELKENKGCHIILLCNKDKINEENKPKFETYIEKIIDVTLAYDPKPWGQFLIVKDLIKNYKIESETFEIDVIKGLPREYNLGGVITDLKINNLREIKKVIHCFNQYCEGLNNSLFNENREGEKMQALFANAILCFLFYYFKIKELSEARKQHSQYAHGNEKEKEERIAQEIKDLEKQIEEYNNRIDWRQTFFFPLSVTLDNLLKKYYDDNTFTFRKDQEEDSQDHLNKEETFISILQEIVRQCDFQKEYDKFLVNEQEDDQDRALKFFDEHKEESSSIWFMLCITPADAASKQFLFTPIEWKPLFLNEATKKAFDALLKNNPQYKKKIQELVQEAFDKVEDQNNHWLNRYRKNINHILEDKGIVL